MIHGLHKDMYVPRRTAPVACIKDMADYINRVLGCCTVDAESTVLVLASLVTYFTFEEIYQVFPVYNNSIANAISRLEKRGYLRRNPFPRFDGMSKKYFSITSAGHDVANSFFLGTIPVRYRYGRKENAVAHMYSAGINLFAFLSYGIPISWKREMLLSGKNAAAQKGSLRADACICAYEGMEKERQFYIEQDMGFERDAELYGKMENYCLNGIMDNPQDAIIFSFRYKDISVTKPSRAGTVYSRTGVNSILLKMREHNLQDARQLLKLYPDDRFLQEFLTVCGAVKMKEGYPVLKNGVKIDEHFLKDFLFTLKFHVNEYVLKDLNKKQAVLAKNRLAQFVALFYDWIDKGQLSGILHQMLQGFPLYFIPTSLMSSYGEILFPEELGINGKIHETLSGCYGPLGKYQVLSPTLSLKNGYTMHFRNAFPYMINGRYEGYVCMEFLNIDLSAWIRLRMFQAYYEGDVPVHVIAVLNDQKQVNDLYQYLGCYYMEMAVVLDKKAVLSCMYNDLGQENMLFTVADPFGTERLYHNVGCTYRELYSDS